MEWSEEAGVPRRWKIIVNDQERRIGAGILSPQELDRITSPEELFEAEKKGAIKYAVRSLARQGMHSVKLSKMLRRHFVAEDVISAVIAYAQQQGWLDDKGWMEAKMRSWERLGKSQSYIRSKLAEYGIQAKVRFDEDAALAAIVTKKHKSLLDPSLPYQLRVRSLQSLLRRGFSYQKVKEFLQKNTGICMMGEE